MNLDPKKPCGFDTSAAVIKLVAPHIAAILNLTQLCNHSSLSNKFPSLQKMAIVTLL